MLIFLLICNYFIITFLKPLSWYSVLVLHLSVYPFCVYPPCPTIFPPLLWPFLKRLSLYFSSSYTWERSKIFRMPSISNTTAPNKATDIPSRSQIVSLDFLSWSSQVTILVPVDHFRQNQIIFLISFISNVFLLPKEIDQDTDQN